MGEARGAHGEDKCIQNVAHRTWREETCRKTSA
jgi:hypothetical protein